LWNCLHYYHNFAAMRLIGLISVGQQQHNLSRIMQPAWCRVLRAVGGCENRTGVAAQYLWVGKSGFSPGRSCSPYRTARCITCEGMTLGHALTKQNVSNGYW